MNLLSNFLISESATIEDAIALIQKNNSRCVIVSGRDRKVVGVFSEGDVLRAVLAGVDIHTPLRGLIKPSFQYLQTRDLTAARKMLLTGTTLIPVVNEEFELESVITLRDVFVEDKTSKL